MDERSITSYIVQGLHNTNLALQFYRDIPLSVTELLKSVDCYLSFENTLKLHKEPYKPKPDTKEKKSIDKFKSSRDTEQKPVQFTKKKKTRKNLTRHVHSISRVHTEFEIAL